MAQGGARAHARGIGAALAAALAAACVCMVWASRWGAGGARGGEAALVQRAPLAGTGVLSRREMNAMSLRALRDEHEVLEKRLSQVLATCMWRAGRACVHVICLCVDVGIATEQVRERLENRRLESKVASLQQSIDALRQRAALASKAGGPGSTMLRKVEYKAPWSQGLGQTFTDDNNPLYAATPADKVMDPEERPFLR
jgi:hypothetical protein